MRKQYHFRPSDRGLRAWDVERLISLSKHFLAREIPLTDIRELDEPFWFEAGINSPTCREVAMHARLIEETDLLYPIILSSNGRVMDGMHRVAKAFIQGHTHIRAVQFLDDPEPDFIGVDPGDLPY